MKSVLITGGAGFIGTNLAHRLLSLGDSVILADNLSRAGVDRNLRWLCAQFDGRLSVEIVDVRDELALQRIVPRVSSIYHLAAQTAVTTSMVDPELDFDVNARGTLCVLEAARACATAPKLVYTSTNKVYGGLSGIELACHGSRYEPVDPELRTHGISERHPLDFHTPYGCSKGTADQYVLEYARAYDVPSVVFRMSCIYGPHQCGTEDQGWVAHFVIRALDGEPITIYGDGKQVRDLLYVDDLVNAFLLANQHMDRLAGQAFNIGGGPAQLASLLEVIAGIEALHGTCPIEFGPWRPSDQRYYASDTRKFSEATGWKPRIGVEEGLSRLYAWFVRDRRPGRARGRAQTGRITDRNPETSHTMRHDPS